MRALRALGFDGPFYGTRHRFRICAARRLTISSNPEHSVPQLWFLQRSVEGTLGREISLDEWECLRVGRTDDGGDRCGAVPYRIVSPSSVASNATAVSVLHPPASSVGFSSTQSTDRIGPSHPRSRRSTCDASR